MAKERQYRYFVCDFETTVYKGQTDTEVWASASVEMFSNEQPKIFNSIEQQFEYFKSLNCNIIAYYHNLKFDGSFWLSYLMVDLGFKNAFKPFNEDGTEGEWQKDWLMYNNTLKYSITDLGQWYTITFKVNNHFIVLRDSLKLLPFSVKEIGKAFKTKHQKLEMEYEGFRYSGCEITKEEREYIANDVLVVKEALEIMFQQGHNKLTIGSCCLGEYKHLISKEDYNELFPDLTKISLHSMFNDDNADEWIRKSYKGGWCYVVKGKENIVYYKGITADVNSLYPSMMSSESDNYYPIGRPHFWYGNMIPKECTKWGKQRYYFVRVKTRFYIKPNYLPFIQIKGNPLYKSTEMLESSDYFDKKTNRYYDKYVDYFGNVKDTRVELTLTMTDFKLFKEHYELVDFEILGGCWFYAQKGIFDEYIEKYKKQKLESSGALRTLAKLFLNNLYGKMASSTDSSFKVAYVKEDKTIGFYTIVEDNKQAGFIAVGSAITSYARDFTIRTAQQNYYGVNKKGFIYADTDSIHCDLEPHELKGLKVHDKNFCCWKLESTWDFGLFVRQKTYIEHVIQEDLENIENPYYNVKCAGMPQKCKDLFIKSVQGIDKVEEKNYNDEELDFIKKGNKITDFKIGLKVPSKLMPRRIRGGVLLVPTTYEMR